MTAATIEQSFLQTLGLLPLAPSPPPIPTDDDPTLWTDPERGGFADGFAATIDELHDIEQRIDQGGVVIAEKQAAGQMVPNTWTLRLRNLATRREEVRRSLSGQYPKALAMVADLVSRLNRQEDWCRQATGDPRFTEREDVYLATLAAYERLAEAIDRAFGPVSEATADDPASVSWVGAWKELRALGFAEKRDVEAVIGGWHHDPREVIRRAKAARSRKVAAPVATPAPDPPLFTISGVKSLMNLIAEDRGMPEQFDGAGNVIRQRSGGSGG